MSKATSELARWKRRRYRVAAGIGLAATLSTGALVTALVMHDGSEVPRNAGQGPETSAASVPVPIATPGTTAPPSTTPSVGISPSAKTAQVIPPRTPASGKKPVELSAVTMTVTGSLPKDHHTLHVWSARADLSAQREMTWVADAGHKVGKVRCTQKFRFTPEAPVVEKPTALLCWRITPTKSVYILAVDLDHRPSEKAAEATIAKVWSKLG